MSVSIIVGVCVVVLITVVLGWHALNMRLELDTARTNYAELERRRAHEHELVAEYRKELADARASALTLEGALADALRQREAQREAHRQFERMAIELRPALDAERQALAEERQTRQQLELARSELQMELDAVRETLQRHQDAATAQERALALYVTTVRESACIPPAVRAALDRDPELWLHSKSTSSPATPSPGCADTAAHSGARCAG